MKKLVLLLLLTLTLTACGGGMYIGTGQKFDGFTANSEPDKSALVYFIALMAGVTANMKTNHS